MDDDDINSPPQQAKSPAGAVGSGPTPDATTSKPRSGAAVVRDAVIPALLHTAMFPRGTKIDRSIVLDYRNELLHDAGDPKDPLERMLIEQAAAAHVMVFQLHAAAALADSPEAAGIFSAAATKLMAELRRTVLGIRDYRTGPVRPVLTRIEQQNVAQTQEVCYVSRDDGNDVTMLCREKSDGTSKVDGNSTEDSDDSPGFGRLGEIAGPQRRGSKKSVASGAAE